MCTYVGNYVFSWDDQNLIVPVKVDILLFVLEVVIKFGLGLSAH